MRNPFLIVALVTAMATLILYEPINILFFKLKEPYYSYPIKTGRNNPVVRSDGQGDGEYGAKRNGGRTHDGIDILAPVGTPVYAAKSGTAFRLNVPTGYGKYVMIYHPDRAQTIYAHLMDWNVRSTQRVYRGELIGFVGKSGNAADISIQPHLHFEIRKNGLPVDPEGKLRR